MTRPLTPAGPSALRAEVRAAIDASRAALAAFGALPPETPWGEVALAHDRIGQPLDGVVGRVGLLSAVHPERAMRERAEELEQELVAWATELSLHRGTFERLAALDLEAAPGPEERRLVELALRDFRRSGVDRGEDVRERVRALQDELVRIGQEFDRNIVEGTRTLRIPDGHAGLAGLPEDFVAAHPEASDGSVTVTTDLPDLLPFLHYAERADLRFALSRERSNQAWPENGPVLERLLARRHELATLLGYASWAAYATEDKMVATAEGARAFVERVAERARERARAEALELLEELRTVDPDATAVPTSDRAYLKERVRRKRFGFDSQSVRPYLPYEGVRDGVLATAAALYGVDFRRDAQARVWHPSVEAYEVLDGGRVSARFYLDMFPREGKFKHAAMFDVYAGVPGESLPEAALVCNFPPSTPQRPALLLHEQLRTFFHELGHLLHHLFAGGQRYLRFSGIATEWDFVEAPSQMFEEWAWDPRVLARFARHHETGEPIPADLVRRMRAAEEYGKGLQVATQAGYARLSLAYHERDPAGIDTTALMRSIVGASTPLVSDPDSHFQAAFGHLNGYSATYYTYLWSLVIAKDLYGRFQPDPMDSATANDYRQTVLAPGGSRDAAELVHAFLGRDYDFAAWEAWLRNREEKEVANEDTEGQAATTGSRDQSCDDSEDVPDCGDGQ